MPSELGERKMPAFDLRGNSPDGVEDYADDYGVDGPFVSGEEVRHEDAHGDAPSLNRLEYLRQFATHVQDSSCEFSGHACFCRCFGLRPGRRSEPPGQ